VTKTKTVKATVILLIPILFLLASCVTEKQVGDDLIYTLKLYVPLGFLVMGIFGLWLGIKRKPSQNSIQQKPEKFTKKFSRWTLVAGSVLVLVAGVPGAFMDKVRVSEEGFSLKKGFWFAPTQHEIEYSEISKLEVVEKGTGKDKSQTLFYTARDSGVVRKITVGTVLEYGGLKAITTLARLRGVEVSWVDDSS